MARKPNDKFNKKAYELHYHDGLTWNEVAIKLNCTYDRARGAAKAWKAKVKVSAPAVESVPTGFIVDGNEATLNYTGPVRTLAQLVKSHEIDLDVWVQHGDVKHNTWTTPGKDQNGDWSYFQNHQVYAYFMKRKPDRVHPTIEPVVPGTSYPYPVHRARAGRKEVVREIQVGDVHTGYIRDMVTNQLTPFHDRRALDVLVQVVEALQPTYLTFLGDLIDAAEGSDHFFRDPGFYFTMQPSILETYWWLRDIRRVAPNTVIRWIEGNHELRLRRYLGQHYLAAYNLKRADHIDLPPVLSFPNLCAVDTLGVEWVGGYPNNHVDIGGMREGHGNIARKNGGATATALIERSRRSKSQAHVHRGEMVWEHRGDSSDGVLVKSVVIPCMCHTDGRVPGSSDESNWQNGFLVRSFTPNGMSTEQMVEIRNGEAVVDGTFYQYRDRVPDLKQDFPMFLW